MRLPSLLSLLRLAGLLLMALCLSGCVKYDVGIHFKDQHHGEIVQHIRVSDPLTSFSDTAAEQWLANLEQRSRRLGGRIQHRSEQELVAIIPFNNGADLEQTFNQFFSSGDTDTPSPLFPDLPAMTCHLQMQQSNWLLTERNHLIVDLDLRPLAVLSSQGNILVSPGNLLSLEFSLNTPWGGRGSGSSPLIPQENGKQLTWTLNAGTMNHLEATFWVPSPLGMGTVVIVLIVAAGTTLKSMQQV